MARVHLTDKLLRGMTTVGTRLDLWDAVVPGLVVRVSQSNTKTFVLSYRMGGRGSAKQRLTLGTFPTTSLADARTRARVALGQIEGGIDPRGKAPAEEAVEEPPVEALTFGALAEAFLRLHPKSGTRWWLEQKRVIERELLPAWGSTPASDLKRREISALLDKIASRPAPVQANRTRTILSAVFSFGLQRDMVEFNPVATTKKPAQEMARERVLSDGELRRAWTAFEMLSPSLCLHLRFKLFTLQRGGEIRTMERKHVDGNTWTIPRELTKMKRREHRVPLVPSALEILEQATADCAGPALFFPSPKNRLIPVITGAPATACGRICRRCEIVQFTPHDLRRTAATHLAELGVAPMVIALILSHSGAAGDQGVPAVTGIYNRYAYDREKREALLLWEQKLLSILATPQEP